MMRKSVPLFVVVVSAMLLLGFSQFSTASAALTPLEKLGKDLFFDKNLSQPAGQACAACHAPEVGFTGPEQAINLNGGVYEGAVPGRFGNRKPPSAAYAGDSPILHFSSTLGSYVGGMFWDGRATGNTLGDPLAEQAQGPFLNPLEQNLPSAQAVVEKVASSPYAQQFLQYWGPDALSLSDVPGAYARIARSIAAYERSSEVSAFTSKYDAYLKGKASLTAQEQQGLTLFEGKANCAQCHPSRPDAAGNPPLFTDYTYDNLGAPKNPVNPFYTEPAFNPAGFNWVDLGLGGYLMGTGADITVYQPQLGKMKVPTLRNVDRRPTPDFVKCFGHNGYFKSLEQIVHFYNTADVSSIWPSPEVPLNVNRTELGNLGLTTAEEAAIVAFLKTLSDGYTPSIK